MKKILFLLAAAALMLTACRKDEEILVKVSVQLTQFGEPFTETVPVMLASAAASYTQETDETGKALFEVPFGAYTASVSFKKGNTNYNGTTQVVVEMQTAYPETGEILDEKKTGTAEDLFAALEAVKDGPDFASKNVNATFDENGELTEIERNYVPWQ